MYGCAQVPRRAEEEQEPDQQRAARVPARAGAELPAVHGAPRAAHPRHAVARRAPHVRPRPYIPLRHFRAVASDRCYVSELLSSPM